MFVDPTLERRRDLRGHRRRPDGDLVRVRQSCAGAACCRCCCVVLVGFLILIGRDQMLLWFEIPSGAIILREVALGFIALGFIKVAILFVFQTLLARRGIPKIFDDFVLALALVAYGIFRLNAVGVNLTGLIATSTVITAALAFSAQETLGNLWGGIALQMEKTCRIGDWVRIDTVTGQVVSIRWRYMADRDQPERDDRHPELAGDEEPHHA